MRKNDVIKWEARLKPVSVDTRRDEKGKTYFLIRTEKGSRLLTWSSDMAVKIKESLDKPPFGIWKCTGYINQVLGNSFLVLSEAESIEEKVLRECFIDLCE